MSEVKMKKYMKFVMVFSLLLLNLCCSLSIAAEILPAGFVALSSIEMNWKDAKSFCVSNGGKLPLYKGKDSFSYSKSDPRDTIEGFQAWNAKWPSGLPGGEYWLGTEDIDAPELVWTVNGSGDDYEMPVGIDSVNQHNLLRAACVP